MKFYKFQLLINESESYKTIIKALLDEQYSVMTPINNNNTLMFGKIQDVSEVVLPSTYINTVRSAKEYVFPITEPVVEFAFKNNSVTLKDSIPETSKKVIFGLRPCDTASFPVIDDVFNYEYKDEFYNIRREDTILISVACESSDESCFCTSVGIKPDSINGSDILLKKIKSSDIIAIVSTERGDKLITSLKKLFVPVDIIPDDEISPIYKKTEDEIRKPLELEKIKQWLDNNFDSKKWDTVGAACLGCATCAYLCPTCHCFDIVDEMKYDHGLRRKNWDVCQFPVFTVHASGHNPRQNQSKRYRQRVMHKFKYYKDRFNKTLCTGCGRCIRYCPVNLDIYEVVSQITAAEQ